MTDTGAILKQGLTLGELFAVGVDDHVVTIPVSDIFPDQTGHGGEFLQTDGFGNLSWDSAGGGGGTVTTVSVVTANGVSGSVANATTTPAITLTLGAITPSSVAAVGTVTGSNLSGTNTGDQTITLTSDVTGSGTGSFATTIANNAVTYAKMQAVSATSKLLGSSSTTTPVQEITLGSGLSLTGTTLSATGSGGTVTSIDVSGGTTGLTTSGGPVTGSGTITFAGTLAIANGGTGQTTAANAINALLPTQAGHSGEFLTTNGTVASWASLGAGVVTSITGTANQVIASAATGAVTLSTPQNIDTGATPRFARIGLGVAADATARVYGLFDGGANTSNDGLILENSATVSSGNQAYSPSIRLRGFGWKTNATAASQSVDWALENTPIQGAANPTGTLIFKSQVNAGGYTTRMSLTSAGVLSITGGLTSAGTITFSGYTNAVLTVNSSGVVQNNGLNANSILFASSSSAVNGSSVAFTWTSTGGLSMTPAPTTNNAINNLITLDCQNTGTSANGVGAAFYTKLKSSTTVSQDASKVSTIWSDATHATRTSAVTIQTVYNATAIAEAARIAINASGALVTVGVAGTLLGQIGFSGSSSGTTTLKAAAAAGGTFTLPAADGSAGQGLVTDGSGVLSFASVSQIGGGSDITTINTAGATVYFNPFGNNTALPVAITNAIEFTSSKALNLSKLYVSANAAPGAAKSIAFTVFKNGIATTLTATISGAVATTANDTTHTVACVAGDLIAIQVVVSATTASTSISWGFLG